MYLSDKTEKVWRMQMFTMQGCTTERFYEVALWEMKEPGFLGPDSKLKVIWSSIKYIPGILLVIFN